MWHWNYHKTSGTSKKMLHYIVVDGLDR